VEATPIRGNPGDPPGGRARAVQLLLAVSDRRGRPSMRRRDTSRASDANESMTKPWHKLLRPATHKRFLDEGNPIAGALNGGRRLSVDRGLGSSAPWKARESAAVIIANGGIA
jgi:hypothetical protein